MLFAAELSILTSFFCGCLRFYRKTFIRRTLSLVRYRFKTISKQTFPSPDFSNCFPSDSSAKVLFAICFHALSLFSPRCSLMFPPSNVKFFHEKNFNYDNKEKGTFNASFSSPSTTFALVI